MLVISLVNLMVYSWRQSSFCFVAMRALFPFFTLSELKETRDTGVWQVYEPLVCGSLQCPWERFAQNVILEHKPL